MWSKASLKRERTYKMSSLRRFIRRKKKTALAYLMRSKVEGIVLQLQKNAHRPIKRNYRQSKLFIKNKKIAKGLLIDLLFIKLEISKRKRKTLSLLKNFLLNNKYLFTNKSIYTKPYLAGEYQFNLIDKAVDISEALNIPSRIILIYRQIKKSAKKLDKLFRRFVYKLIGKWPIYLSRLIMMIGMHYIVFVQLGTQVFWPTYWCVYTHPIWTYLFQVFPFLLPAIQATMLLMTDDDFSFLMLGLYFQIFIIRFKRYKLPRRIAYQAGLSFILMLVGFAGPSSQDVIKAAYAMGQRILADGQSLAALRDEASFFLDDLHDLREERIGYFLQWVTPLGAQNHANLSPFFDAFTLPQLLGIITLLYNCVYFIIKGRRPYIPIVTKAVRRIMIDRTSPEPL